VNANSLLTNGLDELSADTIVFGPTEEEEEDVGVENIDHVTLASLHLRKLIYNIILTGGGTFNRLLIISGRV
jgi:hypothetical protein